MVLSQHSKLISGRQWNMLLNWKDTLMFISHVDCMNLWLSQMLLELVSIYSVAKARKQNYLISPLHYYIFWAPAMILINFFPNDCQKSYPRILYHVTNKWKYAKYTVFNSYLPSRNKGILLQRTWHLISA